MKPTFHSGAYIYTFIYMLTSLFNYLYMQLIAQQLSLCEPQAEGYVGIVCKSTSPKDVAEEAIQEATYVCERTLGIAPSVTIKVFKFIHRMELSNYLMRAFVNY